MPFSKSTGLRLVNMVKKAAAINYDLPIINHKAPDFDLKTTFVKLGTSNYRFTVTDAEFYAVLGVVSPANALVLLHGGIRSGEEVTEYLSGRGMMSLLRSHKHMTDAALEEGLNPLHFIEFMDSTNVTDRNVDCVVNAVRTYAMEKKEKPNLWFLNCTAQAVLRGDARYEDIKIIGAPLVQRHGDLEALSSRLYDLAGAISEDEYDFDAHHILAAIKRRMESNMDVEVGEALLTLMRECGGDFALSLKNPVQIMRLLQSEKYPSDNKELLSYADAVLDMDAEVVTSFADLEYLYENKVEVHMAFEGLKEGRSGSQIVGMRQGIEPALTQGWL